MRRFGKFAFKHKKMNARHARFMCKRTERRRRVVPKVEQNRALLMELNSKRVVQQLVPTPSNRPGLWSRSRLPKVNIAVMYTSIVLISSVVLSLGLLSGVVHGQTPSTQQSDSPQSTGRTIVPAEGIHQPQGPTGPINTQSGGAPAASPQGETPPGMQAAPGGSDKTIVTPPQTK
jgi:hypothetical protein